MDMPPVVLIDDNTYTWGDIVPNVDTAGAYMQGMPGVAPAAQIPQPAAQVPAAPAAAVPAAPAPSAVAVPKTGPAPVNAEKEIVAATPTAKIPVDMSSKTKLTVDETFWQYQVKAGRLHLNGVPCRLNGINWAGFENREMVVQPLWKASMEDCFKLISESGFNAIRIPVSAEFMEHFDDERIKIGGPKGGDKYAGIAKQTDLDFDADLDGKPPIIAFDKFLKLAYKHQMLVMIDLHSFPAMDPDKGITNTSDFNKSITMTASDKMGIFGTPLSYTLDKVAELWAKLAKFLVDYPHVFGADIKNEPHDAIKWEDWASGVETVGEAILKANPRMCIVAEGIEAGGGVGGWGNGLSGVKTRPIKLSVPNKLIYSPHQYGDAINAQSIEANWEKNFGFITDDDPNACVMIGEWGMGKEEAKDAGFGEKFAAYMEKKKYDSFYWAFQYTSADTVNLTGTGGKELVEKGIKADPKVVAVTQTAMKSKSLPTFPAQPAAA
jgi:endoglucanase